MDLFTISWVGGLLFILYILYSYFMDKGEKYIIDFSEIMGDAFVSHKKTYIGKVSKDGKSIVISGLKGRDNKPLKRPKPAHSALFPTTGNLKKVYLLKISEDRFAYRVCVKDNDVWTYEKNQYGRIITENGKYKLKKFKWNMADNIIEVDDKDWYEMQVKDIQEKHKQKDKWDALKPVITMGVIFVFAIIAMKFMSDNWKHMVDQTHEDTLDTRTDVDRLLNALESYTGTNKLKNEQSLPPEDPRNQVNE